MQTDQELSRGFDSCSQDVVVTEVKRQRHGHVMSDWMSHKSIPLSSTQALLNKLIINMVDLPVIDICYVLLLYCHIT